MLRLFYVKVVSTGLLCLFFALELAADLYQIDGVGHHVLCFLQHGQVKHAHFDAAALTLNALQLLTFQACQFAVQLVGFADFGFHAVVVVVFYAVAASLYQVSDVLADVGKFTFLDGIQRLEVVIDVF